MRRRAVHYTLLMTSDDRFNGAKRAIRWAGKSGPVLAAVAHDQQRQFLPHQVADRVAVSGRGFQLPGWMSRFLNKNSTPSPVGNASARASATTSRPGEQRLYVQDSYGVHNFHTILVYPVARFQLPDEPRDGVAQLIIAWHLNLTSTPPCPMWDFSVLIEKVAAIPCSPLSTART